MKRRLLFVLDRLAIGGTTSALLSLLRELDYDRYEVDLFLLSQDGPLKENLPPGVRLFSLWPYHPGGARTGLPIGRWPALLCEYLLSGVLPIRIRYGLSQEASTARLRLAQWWALKCAMHMRAIPGEYDVAIAYMEMWPTAYTALKVLARMKIAWLHLDYVGAKLDFRADERIYPLFDRIATVSDQCLQSFRSVFPSLAHKGVVVENTVSPGWIRNLANEPAPELSMQKSGLKIVTVCRLDNRHKGLDRAVTACQRLMERGDDFRWYVVGDGPDREALELQIHNCGASRHMIMLGPRKNPYPYIREADLFILPSRYEGKPIVITEAQILGCPALVTDYASAKGQIANNIDGVIVENSDSGLIGGVLDLCGDPVRIRTLRDHLTRRQAYRSTQPDAFYALLNSSGIG